LRAEGRKSELDGGNGKAVGELERPREVPATGVGVNSIVD